MDTIKEKEAQKQIETLCKQNGKELVNISFEEMGNFCGNILCLSNQKGESVVVMSERARQNFKNPKFMDSYEHIVSHDLKTIEELGGGSARCMLAEIF